METRYCIFHVPNHIDPAGKSGSNIRPIKMIEAFKRCGYHVVCVMGYGNERKKAIDCIKKQIESGKKYDFLYSESSTMPTLLTEKNHIPRYPNLDFGFFKYCHRHGIKIGLFYRDIQWKFSVYRDNVKWYKRIFSIPFYKYDLWRYQSLVDLFYLPTKEMSYYLRDKKSLLSKMEILMPGCETQNVPPPPNAICTNDLINIFYVGGVDRIYDLTYFLKAVKSLEGKLRVTICCRESEWNMVKARYGPYLSSNIVIVHASGEELNKYYEKADLCCAFAGTGEYMRMAMPVKIFEYLGHLKPIIATKDTAAGNFVEQEGIGWSAEYNVNRLTECLNGIIEHPEILKEKVKNEFKILNLHTWKARSNQVIRDLCN